MYWSEIFQREGAIRMDIAIITGASSGLGAEYARLLDLEGLDELWLVARRGERLRELAREFRTEARCLALDLAREDGIEALKDELARLSPRVCYLINAAGLGRMGSAAVLPAAELSTMLRLNALLIASVLPFMHAGSRIINVASCAAFQAVPGLAAYAATKSFLRSYSRALTVELEPRGIGVTAVCPYWIRDTEFIGRARATDREGLFKAFPSATGVHTVARRSLCAARRGERVCTPDPISRLDRLAAKLLPHSLLMRLWHRL